MEHPSKRLHPSKEPRQDLANTVYKSNRYGGFYMRAMLLLLTLSLMLMACPPTPPQGIQPTAPSTSSPENTPVSTLPPANQTSAVDSLAGTQWTLESYGQLGAEVAVTDTGSVTLIF